MTNFNRGNNDYSERRPAKIVNPDEVNYQEGYIDGRNSEENYQYEQERGIRARENEVREDERANNGLLLGILILAVLGLGIGAYFLWASNRKPTTIVLPSASPTAPNNSNTNPQSAPREREIVPVPVQPSNRTTIVVPPAPNSPASNNNNRQNTQTEKTIIERTTRDRTREVVPANPPSGAAPEVNVNVTQPPSQTAPNVPSAPPASPSAPVETPASSLNSPQPVPQTTSGSNSPSDSPPNSGSQESAPTSGESGTSPAPTVSVTPVP
jgi:hypothetical protein